MFVRASKRVEMGLGSARDVSLATARQKATAARSLLAGGLDPLEAKRTLPDKRRFRSFGEAADDYIAAHEPGWRNAKHAAQWRMTLTEYAKPLRSMPVEQVDTAAVLATLQPLWRAKPETASRLRGRIEAVIDAARAYGDIEQGVPNPARWKGHLDNLLPKPEILRRGHHAAMPFGDVPAFLERLRSYGGVTASAIQFLILTAARSGEVFGATWSEIDHDARVWTIPAGRMKGGREHRVPLSQEAIRIIEEMGAARTCEFIFPGRSGRGPLSTMAFDMVLRRMNAGATVHGFRSSFRDWCGEKTSFPREVAEAALAHVSGDATERAYRRGDALEKRRELMEFWANFCNPPENDILTPLLRRA